jgi:dihydrofolate reductase
MNSQYRRRSEMRSVVMFNRISLDGFFAGPNGEIDWFIHDSELDKALHGIGKSDILLFGRVTYQLFESVWPKLAADPNAPKEAKATALELEKMTKVVFSKTISKVPWKNSQLAKGDLVSEVKKLKQGTGPSILIFGGGTLVQQLTSAGLIDDYFFGVTPVIIGAGKRLFDGVKTLNLKLVESSSFKSGNVLLHYKR